MKIKCPYCNCDKLHVVEAYLIACDKCKIHWYQEGYG
jgi:hypothetical protein